MAEVARALAQVLAVLAVTLFGSAGTLDYWQAWVFLAIYGAGSVLAVAYLWRHDRALLRRRMRGGPLAEREPAQKVIMTFVSIGFFGMLAVAGVDRRLGWSHEPALLALLGDALVIAGFYGVFEVLRHNSFAATTIQVEAEQRLITTGAYAIVRHPMYAAASLFLLGIPFALGSYWALLGLAVIAPALVLRLLDEERFLRAHLPGYAAYASRVRWRLIPRIY